MPRKLRELQADLRRAGYTPRAAQGSHVVWEHPLTPEQSVTLAGHDGDDAHRYQEREVRVALAALREAQRRQQP
jgi:predicted RNA binding protein YcfA (HicA-like mRNA interferase family)